MKDSFIGLHKVVPVLLLVGVVCSIKCFAQRSNYRAVIDSTTAKLEKLTGYTYDISGVDVDKSIDNPEVSHGKIRDPYHTLMNCFVFLAEDVEDDILTRPNGFIGIYGIKDDSIVWQSVLLSENFSSGALGSVSATGELNRDGKVEIIIDQATGNLAVNHQLWIFSWDGKDGRLITQLDNFGRPEIMYWGDEYDIKDVDGDGIYEILGEWYENNNSQKRTTVVYSWDGSLYGKWGRSSKYLTEEKKK